MVFEREGDSDPPRARQTLHKFKTNQTFSGDKAYIGENQIITPHKKPKNGELTENQRQENKALSSKRIFVEHLIRVIKVFKVVQERFRLLERQLCWRINLMEDQFDGGFNPNKLFTPCRRWGFKPKGWFAAIVQRYLRSKEQPPAKLPSAECLPAEG